MAYGQTYKSPLNLSLYLSPPPQESSDSENKMSTRLFFVIETRPKRSGLKFTAEWFGVSALLYGPPFVPKPDQARTRERVRIHRGIYKGIMGPWAFGPVGPWAHHGPGPGPARARAGSPDGSSTTPAHKISPEIYTAVSGGKDNSAPAEDPDNKNPSPRPHQLLLIWGWGPYMARALIWPTSRGPRARKTFH